MGHTMNDTIKKIPFYTLVTAYVILALTFGLYVPDDIKKQHNFE